MGKRKIEIKKIDNKNSRQVCFTKRRQGLFKKSKELSILCGIDVAVLVFSPAGNFFSFANRDIDSILDRYYKQNSRRSTFGVSNSVMGDKVNVEKMEEEEEEELQQQLNSLQEQERGYHETMGLSSALVPSSSDMTTCAAKEEKLQQLFNSLQQVRGPSSSDMTMCAAEEEERQQLLNSLQEVRGPSLSDMAMCAVEDPLPTFWIGDAPDATYVKPPFPSVPLFLEFAKDDEQLMSDFIQDNGLVKPIWKEDEDEGDQRVMSMISELSSEENFDYTFPDELLKPNFKEGEDEDDQGVMSLISELSREANFDYIFPDLF